MSLMNDRPCPADQRVENGQRRAEARFCPQACAHFEMRDANSATRLPRCAAVSKSPDRGASSGDASAGDTASAPPNPAVQFTSVGSLAFLLAGSRPVPIQICPCYCDKVQKYAIVANLSPFTEAEL